MTQCFGHVMLRIAANGSLGGTINAITLSFKRYGLDAVELPIQIGRHSVVESLGRVGLARHAVSLDEVCRCGSVVDSKVKIGC